MIKEAIMKNFRKLSALLLALCMAAALLAGCSGGKSGSDSNSGSGSSSAPPAASTQGASGDVIYDGDGTVYMAITDSRIARCLSFDVPFVEKWLNIYAPNVELKVIDPLGDNQKQLQQIEGAVASGCDFLVYMPCDEYSAAGALNFLNSEEIPFCSLAHTPFGGNVPMFVTMPFPSIAQQYVDYMENEILPDAGGPLKIAGIWGAQGFLFYDQLLGVYSEAFERWEREGKVEVVFEADTNDWSANPAVPVAEQMLTQTGNDVDVIFTMNDDIMTGIVSVLKEQDIVEDVLLLGGCDSTVEGLARTQEGWQVADVLPNYEEQSKAVAKIAATYLATGEYPLDMANGATDNEFVEGGIPSVMVDALMITKDNIAEEIVGKGVTTQEAIDDVAKTLR